MRPLDGWGIEMVPIRVVMSLAIIGAILGVWAMGVYVLEPTLASQRLRGECEGIAAELVSLVRGGTPRDLRDPMAGLGTRRVIPMEVPKGCVFVSFGGDPDPDGDGVLDAGVTGTGAVIVFLVQGASKEVVWLLDQDVGFRSGVFDEERFLLGTGSLILEKEGRTMLAFELVRDSENMYILVYRV